LSIEIYTICATRLPALTFWVFTLFWTFISTICILLMVLYGCVNKVISFLWYDVDPKIIRMGGEITHLWRQLDCTNQCSLTLKMMIISVFTIYKSRHLDVIIFHVLQLQVLQNKTSANLILKFEHYPNWVRVIISVWFFDLFFLIP
jgi:hypothetical protein